MGCLPGILITGMNPTIRRQRIRIGDWNLAKLSAPAAECRIRDRESQFGIRLPRLIDGAFDALLEGRPMLTGFVQLEWKSDETFLPPDDREDQNVADAQAIRKGGHRRELFQV